MREMLKGVLLRRSTVLRPCRNSAFVLSSIRRSEGRRWPGLRGMGERPLLLNRRLTGLLTLLRLLARLPARLAPLLTLLLLTLRLRFLRLTGEGLDSEELTAFALGFFSTLSEPVESEAAGLAFVLASFFRGFASLSESLAAGLLLFSGLLLTGDFTLTGCSSFFSLGPAPSESESDAGLSALTLACSAFLTGLALSLLV